MTRLLAVAAILATSTTMVLADQTSNTLKEITVEVRRGEQPGTKSTIVYDGTPESARVQALVTRDYRKESERPGRLSDIDLAELRTGYDLQTVPVLKDGHLHLELSGSVTELLALRSRSIEGNPSRFVDEPEIIGFSVDDTVPLVLNADGSWSYEGRAPNGYRIVARVSDVH